MAYVDAPMRGQQKRLKPLPPDYLDAPLRGRIQPPTKPPPTARPMATPASRPTAAAPTPQQPGGSAYDISTDPILQQIKALTGKRRGEVESGARTARQQLAIEYGDEGLGREYGGESFATAARDNPFSVARELSRWYSDTGRDLDEGFNKGNLFYSGARAKGLSEHTLGYQRRTSQAESEKQQRLSAIASELAQTLSGLDMEDVDAQTDAGQRALERSLQYGIDPGAGSKAALTGSVGRLGELPVSSDVLEQLLARKQHGTARRGIGFES